MSVVRQLMLKAEPYVFKALGPLLSGRKVRYQRSILAQKYLRGRGAEIGAFESPTLVPSGSQTLYIDRVPASHWRDEPQYKGLTIVEPDILDDGAELSSIPDDSYDYLVAAHVLEHVPCSIATLKNWLRVVRPGGILLVIVPDMRFTFDKDRELTSLSHFFEDYENGPEIEAHHRECGEKLLGLTGKELDDYVSRGDPAIHFHTFTAESLMRLLLELDGFEILESGLNVNEAYAVLKKL